MPLCRIVLRWIPAVDKKSWKKISNKEQYSRAPVSIDSVSEFYRGPKTNGELKI
jgi:hypothetical protein